MKNLIIFGVLLLSSLVLGAPKPPLVTCFGHASLRDSAGRTVKIEHLAPFTLRQNKPQGGKVRDFDFKAKLTPRGPADSGMITFYELELEIKKQKTKAFTSAVAPKPNQRYYVGHVVEDEDAMLICDVNS